MKALMKLSLQEMETLRFVFRQFSCFKLKFITHNILFQSWCFRYGNKYVIPRKIITDGLCQSDVFENITLEGTASKTQKCYASCGTGVAVSFVNTIVTYPAALRNVRK